MQKILKKVLRFAATITFFLFFAMKDDIYCIKPATRNGLTVSYAGRYVGVLAETPALLQVSLLQEGKPFMVHRGKVKLQIVTPDTLTQAKHIIRQCAVVVVGWKQSDKVPAVRSTHSLKWNTDNVVRSMVSEDRCTQLCELVLRHSSHSTAGILAARQTCASVLTYLEQ